MIVDDDKVVFSLACELGLPELDPVTFARFASKVKSVDCGSTVVLEYSANVLAGRFVDVDPRVTTCVSFRYPVRAQIVYNVEMDGVVHFDDVVRHGVGA